MLEPCEGKLSCTVLRGESGSNTADLLDQILENKQKFISQIMTSKSPVRACEDVDDTALSYAEIKALATGNPYIKEKMDMDVQVSKLKLLKANHTSQIYRLESDIAKNFPVQISALKERIAGMQVDSQVVKSVDLQDNDTFAMTVGNVLYEDKKEAGEALIAACAGLKTVSTGGKVGEYHGFTLSASYNMFSNAFELTIKGKCSYKLEIGKDPVGNMQRIHNTLSSIDRKLTESEQKLETVQQQLATAQEEVKKPFPKEAELNEKMERLSELNALLNMDESGSRKYCLYCLQPFWSGYFRIFVYLYRQLVREQGYEGVESIYGYHPKNIGRDH